MARLNYLIFASAAEAAGRATANILVIVGFIVALVGYRRRRHRGGRATGWLLATIVLGLLVLGAITNARQGGRVFRDH